MKASWNDGWYHSSLLVDQLRILQNGTSVRVNELRRQLNGNWNFNMGPKIGIIW